MEQAGWRLAVKRAIDVSIASTILIVTTPILAASVLVVRATMGEPAIFRQERPGKHGKLFGVLKLRTMRDARDAAGRVLGDEARLTRVGRFLRAWSLDDLPQLWNVVRGEMSLVGPRPLLVQYLGRYTKEQARRHDVLPGITGWVQVSGRNGLTWEEKFAHDVWYVDHWSLGLDLKILAMTARSVLWREGISAYGAATMPEFMGTLATMN